MKRRLLAMTLSLLMVVSVTNTSVLAYNQLSEADAVKSAAEEYLRTQMNRVYQWDTANNMEPQTILTAEQAHADIRSSLEPPLYLSDSEKSFIENESVDVMESLGRSSITAEDMAADLQAMENFVLYRSHIFEDMDIAFTSFGADYYFDDVAVKGDCAIAKVYESLVYQYTDSPDESSELNYYYVVLKKANDTWYVADVVSDDIPYLAFLDDGLTATEAIAGYDAAIKIENTATDLPIMSAAASNDIGYGVSNAVNYALMYTTTIDNPVADGGQGSTSTPTFKNERFKWFGSDCMNFASQCVWAGFGGSNNYSHVNNKYGMDTSGAYTWWCTKSSNVNSWSSCSAFNTYIKNSNSSTEKGLQGDIEVTPYNSSTITWDYAANDLVGSVMHVRGKDKNGNWAPFAHAVFVNAANSLSRSDIFICCYNSCKKNVKLGTYWSAGNDSTYGIRTIKPRVFVQGETGARVWGDWVTNVTVTNTRRTLKGYGNQIFTTLTLKLMANNGGVVKTWTANNASSVTGTYADWYSTGDTEWIIEVTGTTSTGTTVTWNGAVRVAKS